MIALNASKKSQGENLNAQIELPYANRQPNELQVNLLKKQQQSSPPYDQNFQPLTILIHL